MRRGGAGDVGTDRVALSMSRHIGRFNHTGRGRHGKGCADACGSVAKSTLPGFTFLIIR